MLLDGFRSFDFLYDTKDVIQFLDSIVGSVGPLFISSAQTNVFCLDFIVTDVAMG